MEEQGLVNYTIMTQQILQSGVLVLYQHTSQLGIADLSNQLYCGHFCCLFSDVVPKSGLLLKLLMSRLRMYMNCGVVEQAVDIILNNQPQYNMRLSL